MLSATFYRYALKTVGFDDVDLVKDVNTETGDFTYGKPKIGMVHF